MPDSQAVELSVDLVQLNRLEMMATKVTLAPDETIFTEDGIDQCVYLLAQGTARLYKSASNGRRQIIGFAVAGDFLSLPHNPKRWSASAIDHVVLYRLSRVALLRFMESSPQFIGAIGDLLRNEVRASRAQIVLLGRGNPEQKLMAWLFAWRERSRQNGADATDIRLPMRRKDIAEYLNLTVATVSRTLSRFERDGLIAITPAGVRIVDLDGALALARSIDTSAASRSSSVATVSTVVATRFSALLISIVERFAACGADEAMWWLVA
jgi:CRP/FNR family transcriptional regulator